MKPKCIFPNKHYSSTMASFEEKRRRLIREINIIRISLMKKKFELSELVDEMHSFGEKSLREAMDYPSFPLLFEPRPMLRRPHGKLHTKKVI